MMQAEREGGRGNGYRQESCCHRLCQGTGPMAARYIYAIIFLLANISAWAVRGNHITFFEWQRLNGCLGDRDCLSAEVVMIISLVSFLFFLFMFFSTMYTRKVHDCRSIWHSQWWIVKIIVLLVGSYMISTLAPSYWTQLYGKVSHFGAGVFLFIQLLSVIRCITRLNYKWCHMNFQNRIYEIGWLQELLSPIFGIGGPQQQSEMGSNSDDDEGIAIGGPPPSPFSQSQTTVELEEILSTSDATGGPPPSPVVSQTGGDDQQLQEMYAHAIALHCVLRPPAQQGDGVDI